MDPDHNDRVEPTLRALRGNGYAVWHGWVDKPDLSALHAEAHRVLDTIPRSEYPYGRMVKLSTVDLTDVAPAASQLLLDGPIDAVCRAYGARSEHDYLCWTEETEPDAGRGPGRPHVGPTRMLKLIVYLSDVLSTAGPFRIHSTDRETAEQRWLATWRHLLGLGDTVTDEDVYHRAAAYSQSRDEAMPNADAEPIDAVDAAALQPVLAVAGSVVFFDTQVLHCGGSIDPGGYRITARRHCSLPLP